LKKIVILKRFSIDSSEGYILSECLRIMFPECEIEIRSDPYLNSPDEKINIKPNQNQFAFSKR